MLIGQAQAQKFKGKIFGDQEVEAVQVLNKSTTIFTLTSKKGEFDIPAKSGDTIVFSALQYAEVTLILKAKDLLYPAKIYLKPVTYSLDEVLIGNTLSGLLYQDIDFVKLVKPITMQGEGLPAFEGIPIEKIPPIYKIYQLSPVGISIDVEAAYKLHTGYYRKLKEKRRLEAENKVIQDIIKYYSADFLIKEYEIDAPLLEDFVLFCIEQQSLSHLFALNRHAQVLEVMRINSINYNLTRLGE